MPTTNLSVFTKKSGPLTKVISLDAAGELVKDSTQCALFAGTYKRTTVNGVKGLDTLLNQLHSSQAVSYGVASAEEAEITTAAKAHEHPEAITRSRSMFFWGESAFLMIDYDPVDQALDPTQLHNLICAAMPDLAGVEMLWRPSASSCIYEGDIERIGVTGQRLYFVVDRGDRLEEVGKILAQRLWIAGHGYILISKSGAMLPRCPVDTVVWQPERLDFAAGAACVEPLYRKPRRGILFPGEPALITANVEPLTDIETREYERVLGEATQKAKPQQQKTIELYIDDQVRELAGPDADESTRTRLEQTIRMAAESYFLTSDFVLQLDHFGRINVGDVLANKQKYHGETLRDPLEPDYGGGRGKAKLFLTGTRPVVHSFAHGGRTFQLRVQTRAIQTGAGRLHEMTEAVADILIAEPDLFCNDAGPIMVDESITGTPRQQRVNVETLTLRAAANARFFRAKKDGRQVDCDVPERVMRTLANRKDRFGLRVLADIVSAPTLRPDGSILQASGYDKSTQLLLLTDATLPHIPERPTEKQRQQALDLLWEPVSKFNFATGLDKSTMFAAMLTATVRRSLPTAPGIVLSAGVAGSGKTKLAQILSILAGGDAATNAYPHEKEELRKNINGSLMEGAPSILFDNLTGHLFSDLLCAILSSPFHKDRILGSKDKILMSTRSMFLFTGNNLETAGDLSRRITPIYLDPECEHPWRRKFDFEPVSMVRRKRMVLVAAALTLLRGYIAAGQPSQVDTHTGSFEEWSQLIRQAVIWYGYEDPEQGLFSNFESDPDTENLRLVLTAWYEAHGTTFVLNDEIQTMFGQFVPTSPLKEAFNIVVAGGVANAKNVTQWLGYKKGRYVDGMRFSKCTEKNKRGWRLNKRV